MAFTCPRCGRTSYHPEDEKQGYCSACHDFTGDDRLLSLLKDAVNPAPPAAYINTSALTKETLQAAIEAVRNDTSVRICPANGDKHLIHPKEYEQGWGVCFCGQLIITDQEKYDRAHEG